MKEKTELTEEERKDLLDQILYRAHRKRTICEVLREIWDLAEVTDEDIREELEERILIAYEMAKKMNRKLREYKNDWDGQFWEVNKDYKRDLRRREKRKNESC